MNNLFDGLDDLGFEKVDDLEVFKPAANTTEEFMPKPKPGERIITPEECLFDKSYTCPVCGNDFKEKTVKTSKARFVKTTEDLMPIYTPIFPFFYNIVLCPKCGYAALTANFLKIANSQCDLIKANITPKFKPKKYDIPFTEKDAIERHKLALLNTMVKNGKSSERAYICLVISWLYKLTKDEDNRLLFAKNAWELFEEAYSNEPFPFYGMDENVTAYLIGALANLNGDYEGALKWIGRVFSSRSTTAKLKDMSLELKNSIRTRMEKGSGQSNA